MTPELTWLAATCLFTSLLWVPYVINRVLVGPGLLVEVGTPDEETVLSPWAARLRKAHDNAIANLAVFAPLVLAAHLAEVHSSLTVAACAVYFAARVVHAVVYATGTPWLRTLSFCVGFGCQALLAVLLLMA